MFNINVFKRRISFSSYKYVICMLFILSGVYIAVVNYKTDFQILKKDNLFLLNSLIKNLIVLMLIRYASYGRMKYITAPVLLVYSGVGLGTFLMFVLYLFPLYKFLLTIFPCTLKTFGSICLCFECFEVEKSYSCMNIYVGAIICVLGDVLLFLMV